MTSYTSTPHIMNYGHVIEATVVIRCPYCDTEQKIMVNLKTRRPEIMLCDNEVGGCDQYFVAITNLEANISVYEIDDA